MRVSNVKVNDLEESIKASKYPMAVDTAKCDTSVTNTVKALAHSQKGAAMTSF